MPKKMINGREIELNRKHVNWGHLILHIVLLGVCLISIFPFIWMISSSLKDSELIFSFPPQLIPNPVTWQNYPEAWKATAMGRAMILMTPYFMEPNRADPMRARMDEYGAIVKELAEKLRLVFVDLQKAWDELFVHMHPCNIAWDRIHPNQTGCMYIAKKFLSAVGFDR